MLFDSEGDPTGENADGSFEPFAWDTATETLEQLTNSDKDSGNGGFDILVYDVQAGSCTRVTDLPTGEAFTPSISDDGLRIAFQSGGNPVGGNADGFSEIFLATCPPALVFVDGFDDGNTDPWIVP